MPLVFFTTDSGDSVWYGPLYIGRLLLTEFFQAADATTQSSGTSTGAGRTLTITGQESWPPLDGVSDVRYRGEQLMAMDGMTVPVVFSSKTDRNGFYTVTQPQVTYNHYGDVVSSCDWSVVLERLGTDAEMQIESRLIGGQRVSFYVGNAAERWHSPGAGVVGYLAGTTVPASIFRRGTEGNVTLFRGLAPGASARWGTTVQTYLDGGSRVTVADDLMCGLTTQNHPDNWTLENTLLQIQPDSRATFLLFSCNEYEGDYAFSQSWSVYVGADLLTNPSFMSILRNDPEECIVRLNYNTPSGYSTVDLSLRRGARFISIIAQHQDSKTFTFIPTVNAPATDSGEGYLYQAANGSDGNRFTAGSAAQVDVSITLGSLANHVPATFFSAYVGVELAGTAAVNGDRAVDLAAQYLGTPSEDTRLIRR